MKLIKNQIYFVAVLLFILLLVVFAAGCGRDAGEKNSEPAASEGVKETVTLYFSDAQAQYLKPENREVVIKNDSLEEVVIEELIKGPEDTALRRTVPEEAELLSVSVSEGVVSVNFSQEFKTKHWGGSTGEILTLYSVVDTLAELPGITSVQFMLEGEKMDTLAGHFGTENPLEPDWTLVQAEQ
jgi:spore germination protein GerM